MKKIIAAFCLCIACLGLVSCNKAASPVTDISYDGMTVSWNKASNAASYKVQINKGTIYQPTSTSIAYAATAATTVVEVSVISLNKKKVESEAVVRQFTRLTTIEQVNFAEDGTMSWDAVDGATSYEVKLNGKTKTVTECQFDDFEAGKENSIQIRPIGTPDSTFSSFSKTITRVYLGVPTNIQYDGQFLSWDGQSSAKGYDVYVDGNRIDTVTKSQIAYDANGKSFKAQVKALGDEATSRLVFSSDISDAKNFYSLATPTDFEVSEGVISWGKVEGASSYKVKVDGTTSVVTDPFYDKLSAGTTHSITVMPIATDGATYFSSWSEVQSVNILKAPIPQWNKNLSLDDGEAKNNFFWDSVNGNVGGYTVKVVFNGGTPVTTSLSSLDKDFEYAFYDVGTYEVSVQANAQPNKDTYDSKFSEAVTVIR